MEAQINIENRNEYILINGIGIFINADIATKNFKKICEELCIGKYNKYKAIVNLIDSTAVGSEFIGGMMKFRSDNSESCKCKGVYVITNDYILKTLKEMGVYDYLTIFDNMEDALKSLDIDNTKQN